jgi:hypothetical protein
MKQLDNELQELRGKIAAGASTEMLAPATARVDIARGFCRKLCLAVGLGMIAGNDPSEQQDDRVQGQPF